MKRLILTILLIQSTWSQEDTTSASPLNESTDSVMVDTLAQAPILDENSQNSAILDPSIPLTLDAGYKGFLWGSSSKIDIITNFTLIKSEDTLSQNKSYQGRLGPDSVIVHYFFADSGFWKVEIDFHLESNSVEKQVQDFLRHEKNISEVYGPPSKINHKESGVSGAYSNLLDQKFSRAFYRSTWNPNPAMIELYLNSSVLMPESDLSIFSANYSVLKLVYYNPDFMHSSEPAPVIEQLPSIFEIY